MQTFPIRLMKKGAVAILFMLTPLILSSQYIGARYLNGVDVYKYEIVDFDGNLVLTLEDNVIPFFSSALVKQHDIESNGWTAKAKERRITHDESFFITEKNQSVLPLSTPDSTFIINFKGELVKSFGKKYSFLSQPRNNIIIGYSPIKGEYGAFMLTYLDSKGQELFGGKKFWEATPFAGGFAIVQEKNQKGDWKIIDRSGKEVLNLTQTLDIHIEEASHFINGFANISVRRSAQEINSINTRIKNIPDSINHYYNTPTNSGENESRVGNILYRVNIKGELQRLDWYTSTLNDIYYRTHYIGEDFENLISQKSGLHNRTVDSVITNQTIFYLVKNTNSPNTLVNAKGEIQYFPGRYNPVKCIKNYVLGKRRKKYVIYNPETKLKLFFEDETPVNYQELLTTSSKPVEEFLLESNRILKINPFGLVSLLNLDGKMLYNFNKSEINNSTRPPLISHLNVMYECPDSLDFEEIYAKFYRLIHIKCQFIDMNDIAPLKGLKMIALSDVNRIENSHIIKQLLNQGVEIAISGKIDFEDLNIDLDNISTGALYINDREILSKK